MQHVVCRTEGTDTMDPIDIDVRWLMAPLTSEGGYQFTISLDLLAISDSYQESHDQCLQSSDANGGRVLVGASVRVLPPLPNASLVAPKSTEAARQRRSLC